jgi:dTMP kinase
VERTLTGHQVLDYWESGMDIGISRDWHDSFVKYQRMLRTEYRKLQKKYGFETINANRTVSTIQKDLRVRVEDILAQYRKK